jgi:hypothetical protein
MKTLALAILVSAFVLGSVTVPASAQSMSACEAKAVDGKGKPLNGAAKTSNVNKCMKEACTAKVDGTKDPNGKKYVGIVRTNMINKCVKGG